jgi:predicted acylesterase/phospholipase RssA
VVEDIKYLVLQGGGIRCAWQAGFVEALDGEGPFRPRAISAVSAGSAVACAIACRRLEFAVHSLKAAIETNKKSHHLTRAFRNERGPRRAEIYRNALLQVFDQAAVDELHAGPDIQVLVTRMSSKLPKYPGLLIGLSLHALQGFSSRPTYRKLRAQFGFFNEFISVKACATPADLADLVLASSCTPPVTPWYSLHGRPVLDGSLSESVPLSGLRENHGRTLALLTVKGSAVRPYPGVVYAEPSEDLSIDSWDFTDSRKIDRLYGLGKKDGSRFLETENTQ